MSDMAEGKRSPLPDLPRYDWVVAVNGSDERFAKETGLARPVSDLLLSRGLVHADDIEGATRFLDASVQTMLPPMTMPGVEEATRKILAAIRRKGPILIFGDFDCDGVVATAILTDVIRSIGGDVRPFIPDRAEGYGLSEAAVTRCLSEGPRPSLLVTVDCGMGAGEALRRFLDLGCEVVVSDHHTPGTPLPEACTIVSTFNEGVPDASRSICGAGVAYKIACGLVTTLHPAPDRTGRARLHGWLDALAIATVADIVPLLGENRVFVSEGLRILNKRPRIGLATLIQETFRRQQDVTTEHIGFILAPHINSAGRMGSALSALELILSQDHDEAKRLSIDLKHFNEDRRKEEQKVLDEANEILRDKQVFDPDRDGAIVVAGKDWHAGTIGIAAARICDTYRRPVVVIAMNGDEGRGSIRAPEGYNAYRALQACSAHLIRFGGHANAAGLGIEGKQIDSFRRAFADECFNQVGAVSQRPGLSISGWLGFGDINGRLLESTARLEPCGMGNPLPRWAISGLSVQPYRMGQDGRHLRLKVTREDGVRLSCVWFGAGPYAQLFGADTRWDIAGTLAVNDYQGDREIQMMVEDARPSVPR